VVALVLQLQRKELLMLSGSLTFNFIIIYSYTNCEYAIFCYTLQLF
jgi:hypothetical protein